MNEETKNNLFNELKSSESNNNWDGTGLGMSIVLKLCNIIGSNIYVDSIENIGTTFLVIFRLDDIVIKDYDMK